MNYEARITNDSGETIALISALSFESLEEQLHKLKAYELKFVPDEPYEEQRDDEATERFPDALFEEQRERSEDYPQGGMLEPYDIEGDR